MVNPVPRFTTFAPHLASSGGVASVANPLGNEWRHTSRTVKVSGNLHTSERSVACGVATCPGSRWGVAQKPRKNEDCKSMKTVGKNSRFLLPGMFGIAIFLRYLTRRKTWTDAQGNEFETDFPFRAVSKGKVR